jgi:hypothetical protein
MVMAKKLVVTVADAEQNQKPTTLKKNISCLGS